jgi:hypothetical protein
MVRVRAEQPGQEDFYFSGLQIGPVVSRSPIVCVPVAFFRG